MPIPGEQQNVRRGKAAVVDSIRATFVNELFPENAWALRYHLYPFPLAGPAIDVLYRPNPGYKPPPRIRRPVKVYVNNFPEVQVLVCDEEFHPQAERLIAHLNRLEGVSAEEIQTVPYWCNWGQGDRKPEPFLD